ncbi:hypothetical protein E4G67_04830 [Candidatus Bathyarchaeota archaeon]|nr:MAG: hypothetical protein E4G67_04830 [Candidatus Bathyarchaeota archaeon]
MAGDLKLVADTIAPFVSKRMEVFGYFGKYYSGYPPSEIANLQSHLNNMSIGFGNQFSQPK